MEIITNISYTLPHVIILTSRKFFNIMQLFSSILAVGAMAPLVSGGCYSGGDKWDSSKDVALRVAKAACNEERGGQLRRIYMWGDHPESKTGTVNVNDGDRCIKLEVDYIWDPHTSDVSKIIYMDTGLDDSSSVPKDQCYDGLQKKINGCEHGGESSYSHWKFKADIQANKC
ncbi:hypothetical protein GGR53DRAFT_490865 [Hypoxylon sp. FL1150]|nr:hypothetical protein GGR53DRAFT_490865 [Hypoxylon sp. FL1150]